MNLTQRIATLLTPFVVATGCAPFLTQVQRNDRSKFIETLHKRMGNHAPVAKSCASIKSRIDRDLCKLENKGKKQKKQERSAALDSIERKVLSLDNKGYKRYKNTVNTAFRISNIRNVQRYSQKVLEESNKNLTNTNYKKGKPLAIFFMALYETTIPLKLKAKSELLNLPKNSSFGIRPLDIKTGEIEKYTDNYKLIVFETGGALQMHSQVQKVANLYKGKARVAGVSIGAHGFKGGFNLGYKGRDKILRGDYVSHVFKPIKNMRMPQTMVVLPPCHSGHGRAQGDNMANAFARAFPGNNVYSCVNTTIWFSTNTDSKGKINPESIYMVGFDGQKPMDCTYVARCEGKPYCDVKEVKSSSGGPLKSLQNIFQDVTKLFSSK